MGKKVLFVVAEYGNAKIKETTKETITQVLEKEDAYVFVKMNDAEKHELYYTLKDDLNKKINDVDNFDYVCLVPNGATLNPDAKKIFNEYQFDRDDNILEVYYPMVLTNVDNMALVLNKHIWNSMIAYEAGVLDIELALKQIDSTIFGSFIPVKLFFNKDYYNEGLKYYQQYHLLNHLADGDNIVMGIPKMLLTVNDWGFKLADVSQEDKLANFLLSRDEWDKTKKELFKEETNG